MKRKLNGLDLFSGIGGLSLALEGWVRSVAYCENEQYCQGVLLSRMRSGELSEAPIWDDVRTLKQELLPEIDIIYGGFPCQDISVAGNGKGLAGERSGLFYEITRLTEEIRPSFVFLENVPAIRTRGLREVIRAFTNLRYDCRWTCVSAAELGAPHIRKRWFLLAHNNSSSLPLEQGRSGGTERQGKVKPELNGDNGIMANSARIGSQEQQQPIGKTKEESSSFSDWASEPDMGRVVHGLPLRTHRIKCLGNAVVPEQAKEAFERLMGLR